MIHGEEGRLAAGYFRDEIKPLLADTLIEFVREIGDSEKSAFLGNASALLFPIDWPEPFGLVLIEAMACGTPVYLPCKPHYRPKPVTTSFSVRNRIFQHIH
jgi:glycosyltransferase involved in cell wall biosynthesis